MIHNSQFDCNFSIKNPLKLSANAIWFSRRESSRFLIYLHKFVDYFEDMQSIFIFYIYFDPFIRFLNKKFSIFYFLFFSSLTSFFHITLFLLPYDMLPCNTYSYIISNLLSTIPLFSLVTTEALYSFLYFLYFSELFTRRQYFLVLFFYKLAIFHSLWDLWSPIIWFEELK